MAMADWMVLMTIDKVYELQKLMTVMELCYNMQASLKLRFHFPLIVIAMCLFVCLCAFVWFCVCVCLSHRLYRTQTTQNAVAKPPVKTTIARMIVANSDVLRFEPL